MDGEVWWAIQSMGSQHDPMSESDMTERLHFTLYWDNRCWIDEYVDDVG